LQEEKEMTMCEANAYLIEGEQENLVLAAVDKVEPQDEGLRLVNIYGEQKFINARIHALSLVEHKILLRV
jgi:predicted RNA-binding protein